MDLSSVCREKPKLRIAGTSVGRAVGAERLIPAGVEEKKKHAPGFQECERSRYFLQCRNVGIAADREAGSRSTTCVTQSVALAPIAMARAFAAQLRRAFKNPLYSMRGGILE